MSKVSKHTPIFMSVKNQLPMPEKHTLHEVISNIQTGVYKELVGKVRSCEDKKERNALKRNLPVFISSLESCKTRKSSDPDKCFIAANRIVLDFDDLTPELISSVRETVREAPAFIADFVSPSGNGLKVIIAVDGGGEAEKHSDAWRAVVGWCKENSLPELDSSGKDVGRLCYVSYDPNAHYTDRVPAPLKLTNLISNNSSGKPKKSVNTSTAPAINDLKSALQFIDPDDRDLWLAIGMALQSTHITQAFELWDTWSKSSDKYDSEDSCRVWESLNGKGINIGTLFYHAQQNGWARLDSSKSFALTDMGNGERLAHSCGDNIRYCVEKKAWVIWNGRYWESSNNGSINRISKGVVRSIYKEAQQATDESLRKSIAAHAHRSESKERVRAMLQMASSEFGIPISIMELDSQSSLLNVKNGTVDLHTGELLPHNKEHMLTGILPFNYDPQATSSKWEQFLSDIFNNDAELIEYIQRCIGYSLTGEVSEQIMFFLFGKGSNGKSTFLNVLSHLFGHYCVRISSQILTQKIDNNTLAAMASLKGKRGVITSEVEEGQRMTESLVKDLTGGDKIIARDLYCKFFEFMPTHKIWQYGNHKPQIRGTDDGIWRRIHLIPFTQSFTGKNKVKDLDRLLIQDVEGILAWAVQGCLKWKKEGLGMPMAVKKASDEYRKAEDIIGHFIDECIVKDNNHDTKTIEAYQVYKIWSVENGYKPCGKKRFIEQMIDHKYVQGHKSTGDYWLGIRANPTPLNISLK